jgi:hypothetical protein
LRTEFSIPIAPLPRSNNTKPLPSGHAIRFAASGAFFAATPGQQYPLQYYFELRSGADNAWLFPGLGKNLQTQPYLVVRSARTQED